MANRQVVTEIVGDAAKWNKASEDASAHASKMGSVFGRAGGSVKTAGLVMAGAAVAAGAAFVAFGIKSIGNAQDQERAWNRVRSVFGKGGASEVIKWSEANRKALGVTDDELELSISKYANWAKHAGESSATATKAAEAMATRASQISLATGQSYDEVFAALTKGSQGASKAVKQFGVDLTPASLAQYAYTHEIAKTGDKLTDTQKAFARQGLILQQTTGYTKDAAAMSGGLADSQRKLRVVIDDVQDGIGAAFLKVATVVLPIVISGFTQLNDFIQSAMPTLQAVVGNVTAAVGASFTWISTNVVPILRTAFAFVVTNVIPALGAAFNWIVKNVLPALGTAFSWFVANIIPKLQVAFAWISANVIPALGAAFDWIVKNVIPPLSAAIRFIVTNVIPPLARAFGFIIENVIPAVGNAFAWINTHVVPPFSTVIRNLGTLIGAVFGTVTTVARALVPVFAAVFGAIGTVIGLFVKAIQVGFNLIFNAVDILERVFRVLGSIVAGIFGAIGGVVRGAINAVIGAVNAVIGAINGIQVHIHMGPVNYDFDGFNIGRIPYLHAGGIVPGQPGSDVMTMLRAGELVVPAGQTGAAGGLTIIIQGPVYGGPAGLDELADAIAGRLRLGGFTRP